MDYKLYDHGTRDFLGWLRNQGALSAGDKLRWAGKDWQIKDGPKIQSGFGNPGLADVFLQEITEPPTQP
jgi:hypothetical protein